jgi:hypothetical protein
MSAVRVFGGMPRLVHPRLKRNRAIDLRFAVYPQKAEAQESRDDAHKHPADEKCPDHADDLLSSVRRRRMPTDDEMP